MNNTPSPITAKMAATFRRGGFADLKIANNIIYWIESRPLEAGRRVIMQLDRNEKLSEATPSNYNVRTRVHEYGGGDFWVHEDTLFFVNDSDQRLYRKDPDGKISAMTPEPERKMALRYTEGVMTSDGQTLICVREVHNTEHEVINDIVTLSLSTGEITPLITGNDFYASPKMSTDGKQLAWITWNHPNMPWDGTELWTADLVDSHGQLTITNAQKKSGGDEESIIQPEWSNNNTLHFISDQTGWWNLYAIHHDETVALAPMEAECGLPQWVFGTNTYTLLENGNIACVVSEMGEKKIALIQPDREIEFLALPWNEFGPNLRSIGNHLIVAASDAAQPPQLICYNTEQRTHKILQNKPSPIEEKLISRPKHITFPTDDNDTAYAFYYAPTITDSTQKPPLLVISHGGPTAATTTEFNLEIQYWTSRGFAVLDVNYRGSTGYGKAYREKLNGQWGIADVQDCVNAAKYLAEKNLVDANKMMIRGRSAGGYTTLCALTFYDIFAAGASYYGVSDCELLVSDTHKFEAQYLESLIGPYPEAKALYRERSPIHAADQLSCPIIFLQGLEDKVVPPSQAENMIKAMKAKGIPYEYVTFEGEQHGFRDAKNIEVALERELAFYKNL